MMPSLRVKTPLNQAAELEVWMSLSSIKWRTGLNWQLSWRFPTNCANLKQTVVIELHDTRVAIGKNQRNSELIITNETLWLCPKQQSPTNQQLSFFLTNRSHRKACWLSAPGKGWHKVVSKTESGNDYFYSEIGRWSSTLRIGPRRAALTNLFQDEKRFPVALWVRNVLMEGIHVLALNSTAMRRPSSPSVSRTFRMDGSNIPLVVRDLRDHYKGDFKD